MKAKEMIAVFRETLEKLYDEGEVSQLIFLVFEHVKGFSKIDLVLKGDEMVSEAEQQQLECILTELKSGTPVQYVLGYAWFCGMKLKVNEHVLIPRQETEELVDWMVNSSKFLVQSSKVEILDVCTGSGCIALALKNEFPLSEVFALDISAEALSVAKENAVLNQAEITFIHSDILSFAILPADSKTPNSKLPTHYDMIVSNPPYVLESEKQRMNKNVLEHEPHLALFVKDTDPLIFYDKISDFALSNLKREGELYFEINEVKGREVVELLIRKGFSDVELKKDLNGKNRMVKATFK